MTTRQKKASIRKFKKTIVWAGLHLDQKNKIQEIKNDGQLDQVHCKEVKIIECN